MQQQQMHHGHGHSPNGAGGPTQPGNHFGPIGPVSPARSLSPNPLSLGLGQNGGDPFYFPSMAMGMYPQFNNHHRNLFDTHFHGADSNGIFAPANNAGGHSSKFNNYLEPHGFYGMAGNHHMQQQPQSPIAMNGGVGGGASLAVGNMKTSNENITNNGKDSAGSNITNNSANSNNNNNAANITVTVTNGSAGESTSVSPVPPTTAATAAANAERQSAANAVAAVAAVAAAATASTAGNSNSQDSSASSNAATNSKLIDGLNSFYSNNSGSYQQLLVAN